LCTRCNTMLGTFERVGWAVICAYVADPQAVAA
jgi:hypothetical protein